MILDTLDLKNKTVFHEINLKENFNTFSVIDYLTNKQGRNQKINNGMTSTIDFCAINDNQILLSYVPATSDKVICKILTVEGTYITIGPLYTIDENTNTSRISVVNLSQDKFVIFYNDNNNKVGKAIIVYISKNKFSTISSNIWYKGIVSELRAIKSMDNEIIVFFQFIKNGIVRLLKYNGAPDNKFSVSEESLFFKGSNLWHLTIKKLKEFYVVAFIDSNHKLNLKILQTTNKISFTHGITYTQPIIDDYFQMISIDNEFLLCYFNNQVQVINLINGQIMQQENIK